MDALLYQRVRWLAPNLTITVGFHGLIGGCLVGLRSFQVLLRIDRAWYQAHPIAEAGADQVAHGFGR
jgi:hypothetical protein